MYKECVQTESDNHWMQMLEINELSENGKAIRKGSGDAIKKVCCYEFGFSCVNCIIVMMNRIRVLFAI